jgi:RNA polymerase primary sigma factor
MKKGEGSTKLVASILPTKLSQTQKHELFEQYKNLVYYVVHKFPYKNKALFEEFCCAGMLGLLHAIEHYDPQKITTFPVYAYKWILQFIKRELRNVATIRLPQVLLVYYPAIREIEKTFFYENKRLPYPDEIMSELIKIYPEIEQKPGIKKRLQSILEEFRVASVELDEAKLTKQYEGSTPSESYLSYFNLYKSYMYEVIKKCLQKLEPRKAMVIKLHFGLESETEWNLAAIGRYLKISRERTRQLLNSALKELKKMITVKSIYLQNRFK